MIAHSSLVTGKNPAHLHQVNLGATLTRFAPSPTGLLHLGHVYAAQIARDLAQQTGGQFLLRFEDIDHTRTRQEFYAACEQDLHWLGFHWDAPPLRQIDRLDAYQAALSALQNLGVLYPCFCTRREIEAELARLTAAPHGPEGPLYPGTCRHLDRSERDARLSEGRIPAWRLDAQTAAAKVGPLTFTDLRHGTIELDPHLLGDVVLTRKDIGTSYHLAVVVDDAFQKITHITRGEDLLPSTHIHRLLQALLKLPEPIYYHHPLVTDDQGRRLAKRDHARSIRTLRESGLSPSDILKLLSDSKLPDCKGIILRS